MASSWILFFSYQDDARSNTHQIYVRIYQVCRFCNKNVTYSFVCGFSNHKFYEDGCVMGRDSVFPGVCRRMPIFQKGLLQP